MAKSAPVATPNSHDTLYTVCPSCGKDLEGKRPQAKFCSPHCRFNFHNSRKRTPERKTPTAVTVSANQISITTAAYPKRIRQQTKLANVLAHLARGNSLNRFEAERVCHDHCLNSTVAEIVKRGIDVSRKDEVIPGYQGRPTRCCRYWLEPDERAKAAVLLGWRT